MLISSKNISNATYNDTCITESSDQFTPITTVMVIVLVHAINCSRSYSCRQELILHAIMPCANIGSGHARVTLQHNATLQAHAMFYR